jgi:glycosyltransferase involved in cell wall biosynthesis
VKNKRDDTPPAETAGKRTAESGLVSVIIPVFNSERFLAEAIESVLAQSHRNLELIVVDDGSTDGGAKAAQGYPVRYFRQEHRGPGAARNFGIRQARGEFLAFLDSDDLWMPEKTARQTVRLAARPELEAVFGWVEQFSAGEAAPPKIRNAGIIKNGIHPGAMLIRSAAFARIGPFAEDRRIGEFLDWYARAMEAVLESEILPEVVLRRRIHDENLMRSPKADTSEYARILKAALDRRRSAQNAGDE